MAATDASCGNSTDNRPERPVKLLFVPENDDESRLAAKMAGCVYESERSSGCVYASKRSTDPIRESDTFSFVLYAGTVNKTLLAPKLVIHRNADEAILAADLTKAVAATLGLKNEHGAVLRITLHNRRFCLTPPVKTLAKQYDKIPKTRRYCNYTEEEAYRLLIHAINERRAAWSSVFDQSSEVIDVYVTFRHFWFTVKWTGSNKLVAPNLFLAKGTCEQSMSRDLVHQVASLANITDRQTIKLTLDSPAGPALTMPLFCLSRDHLPTQNDLQLELKKQWKSLHEHPHNQLLQTPAKPIELFLTAHSPAALAVDTLHQCYTREMSVHAAYLQMDAELRENPRVAVAAIRLDKHLLSKTVPRHLLSNKQFVLQALAVCYKMSGFCSSLLKWTGAKLKDDIDVVTAVVSFEGSLLQHATETMQATKSVVIAAVSNDSEAIKYASGQLHSDPDVIACWARTNQVVSSQI